MQYERGHVVLVKAMGKLFLICLPVVVVATAIIGGLIYLVIRAKL